MQEYIIGIVIIVILYYGYNWYFNKPKRKLMKAICMMRGEKDKRMGGIIYLNELRDGNTHVIGKILNLPPGKHAFHIHETGNLIQGCKSLGGHYNPFNKDHGARVINDANGNIRINYNRHVGDLGNLVTNKKGEAIINFVDPLVKLYGDHNIIGRSLVIHAGVDDLGHGGTEESIKTGSAGTRIACGIIGLA